MSGQDRLELAVAALLGGAAGAFTLDEVEFAAVGLAFAAVGELAGQAAAVECAFAAGEVAGLAGGFAGAGGVDGLVDDLLGDGGVLLEESAETLVDEGLYGAGDVGVELALGLAFELRLRELHADDDDEAFADVIAAEVFFDVFEEAERLAGGVDRAGQRGLEAGEMGSAIDGVDVVGKGEDGLGVGVVVLQRYLHGDAVALCLHVDRLLVQHLFALVDVLDKLCDPAGVLELLVLALAGLRIGGALVGEMNLKAFVKEGELTQALSEGVVVELGYGEDGLVGQEVDFSAAAFAWAHLAELGRGCALGVVLLPGEVVTPDLDVELFAEGVDAAYADAVETARDFVVGGVEFAAGVKHSEDDLDGGHLFAVDDLVVDGDSAAVVDYRDGVVDVDGDIDAGGVAAEGFVDGVVDDFINKVMQTHLAGGADVHCGTQPDSRQTFEDGDVLG